MRKSITILAAIFVCAVFAGSARAQLTNVNTPEPAEIPKPATAGTALSNLSSLSPAQISEQTAIAKRLLISRNTVQRDSVNIAAFDPSTSQINILSLPKAQFLVKGADLYTSTQLGLAVRVHVVSANGVNTAVTIADTRNGNALIPLLVEFPIVKAGVVSETAYYTSAHPALLSNDVTSTGQTYVRRMLDAAAARLAEDGVTVSPDIVDIAEHLCIVEHTDHKRFMHEDRTLLFPEILSLYALNEGNTFRYSVSTAGAGGMIQMIPRTYEAIRQQHSTVSLQPDFVSGMRDHANALEAMLLYMNDTWNHLSQSTEVQEALRNGIATKPELLAAGYNSNPMRLPLYLKNGGADWRTLIPAETQMYLAIYSSIDNTVQLGSGFSEIDSTSGSAQAMTTIAKSSSAAAVLSWLSRSLPISGPFLGRLFR